MAKFAEITVKFKYPLNAENYSIEYPEDYEGMVNQDLEDLREYSISIEDLMTKYDEVTGKVIDYEEPEEVEVIELKD